MTRNLKWIHFWKKEVSNAELQAWLDKLSLYSRKHWLVLLDEKLIRNEC